MEKIIINTGLKGFILIDRITFSDAENISGIKVFENAPVYLGLEVLAQLGAFHVRYVTGFERHAFLLKITRCVMETQAELSGNYNLSGKLVGRSRFAFSHILRARKDDKDIIEGEFVFATVAYGRGFQKEILQDHYRNAFLCLKNDSKTD